MTCASQIQQKMTINISFKFTNKHCYCKMRYILNIHVCIVGFKNPSFMGACLEMKGVKDDAIFKPLYSKPCLSWTKDFGHSCLDRFKSKILLEITIHSFFYPIGKEDIFLSKMLLFLQENLPLIHDRNGQIHVISFIYLIKITFLGQDKSLFYAKEVPLLGKKNPSLWQEKSNPLGQEK